MGLLAIFGITNAWLNLTVSLLLLFGVALYLALVYWTWADARRRVGDRLLVTCATLASLFPFIGTLVYMIVRPPEYLDDVRERELEMAAAEARLAQLEDLHCPYCDFEIERTFLRCPSCLRRLKEPCRTCAKPLDPRWKICPYCEAEVSSAQNRGRARSPGRPSAPRSRSGGSGRAAAPAPAAGASSGEGAEASGSVSSPPAG